MTEMLRARLGDICQFKAGDAFKKELQGRGAGDYPFIKVSDMNHSGNEISITRSENWVDQADVVKNRYKLHEAGSVVFAKIGVALTYNRRRTLRQPTIIDNNMMAAKPFTNLVNERYFYYLLSTLDFNQIVSGSALPYLTQKDLQRIDVSLHQMPEQIHVASLLGALDDKIDLNRRINETLEAMARTIFKDWFVDFGPTRAKMEGRAQYLAPEIWDLFPDTLNEEGKPVGWSACCAGELFEFNPRESVKIGTNSPYLDMAALPVVGLVSNAPKKREYKSGSKFRDGDTLFARITPCLENGKTSFVFGLGDDVIGVGSTEFIVIRSRAPLPKPVSYLLARHPEFRVHAERSMTGTSGRQRTNAEVLSRYEITTPPDDLLWNALGDLIDPIVARIMTNAHESRTLIKTRDLLLPKLMSGDTRLRTADRIPKVDTAGQPDYDTVL